MLQNVALTNDFKLYNFAKSFLICAPEDILLKADPICYFDWIS